MFRTSAASLRLPASSTSIVSNLNRRNFVSTVLLTRYEKTNVSQLKATLRERGLSTSGKKEDLIKRLLSDDTKRAGSNATNPISSSKDGKVSQVNSFSTSSKHQATPTTVTDSDSGLSKGGVVSDGSSRSPHSTKEAAKVLQPEANPPGLPSDKIPKVGETFNIQIPYYPPDPIPSTPIPLVTSYINFEPTNESKEENISVLPKVMTVSDPSTYHGGGVSHSGEDARATTEHPSSSSSSSKSKDSSPSMISQILNDASSSIGVSTKETSQLINKTSELASATNESLKEALKEAGIKIPIPSSSSGSSGGGGEKSGGSGRNRPLNDEETRGLYVLAGIVSGGFLLGGLGEPSKKNKDGSGNDSHSTSLTNDGVTTAPGNKLSGGKGSSGKSVIEAKAVGSKSNALTSTAGNASSEASSGAGIVGGAQRKV